MLLLGACSVIPMLSGSSTGDSGYGGYSEDLSVHRKELIPLERTTLVDTSSYVTEIPDSGYYIPVNDSVDYVLDSIARIRLADNTFSGYSILVFNSLNRTEALKVLGRVYRILPDEESKLVYKQPFFRVMTGKFDHEIHAYGSLKKVKEQFPSAIIVPQNYKIKESGED